MLVSGSVVVLLVCLVSLWLLSLRLRDSSIVDLFWGVGFVIVGWLGVLWGSGDLDRRLLAAILTSLWGLRLSAYLAWRNLGHGEDKRYQAMRAAAGPSWAWKSLFVVFLLQGGLIFLVALPLFVSASSAAPVGFLTMLGGLLVLLGIVFETVGDLQLARFKADPGNKGRVMDRGLWRYTRHPNYFGDTVVWWGLWLLSAGAGPTAALWSLPGPILMTWLLTRVSGVPLLEKGMRERPGYEEYLRRTSAFVPWWPRG